MRITHNIKHVFIKLFINLERS